MKPVVLRSGGAPGQGPGSLEAEGGGQAGGWSSVNTRGNDILRCGKAGGVSSPEKELLWVRSFNLSSVGKPRKNVLKLIR